MTRPTLGRICRRFLRVRGNAGLVACALVLAVPTVANVARAERPRSQRDPDAQRPAQGPPDGGTKPTEGLSADQIEAQRHFQRARELYQAGSYREAIGELEAARALDPKAKELVFNLGVVHEKLGKFDEAIGYFRTYLVMDGVTDAERGKADSIIKRIEGAKREVPPKAAPADTSTSSPPAPAAPPSAAEAPVESEPTAPPPPHGRLDAATLGAASAAVVGLGVGVAFGLHAVATRPSSFVTGRDGSYETLRSQTDDAHRSAIIADVGFGVGIAAALATAYLYFGRTREPARADHPGTTGRALPRVGAAPVAGGSVVVLGGSFR